MKTLALLRHGKSSWEDPELRDHDRPLNERGRKAAVAIGGEMRRRGLAFDLVLASSARRAMETVEHLQVGYGGRLPTRFDDDLYACDGLGLLKLLRTRKRLAEVDRLLIVGHSPALQGLAIELSAYGPDNLAQDIAKHFPTAALAVLKVPVKRWEDLRPGIASPDLYLKPRELNSVGPEVQV